MENVLTTDPEKWEPIDRIRFLLDHWSDIFDPNVTSPFGSPGDGSGVPTMPHMAKHPSVKELARALQTLYEERPALYRHLKAYRCNCEYRNVDHPTPVKLPSGKWDVQIRRRRERLVPPWVSPNYVSRAEDFLASVFRGEVFIPRDLWQGLTKPA